MVARVRPRCRWSSLQSRMVRTLSPTDSSSIACRYRSFVSTLERLYSNLASSTFFFTLKAVSDVLWDVLMCFHRVFHGEWRWYVDHLRRRKSSWQSDSSWHTAIPFSVRTSHDHYQRIIKFWSYFQKFIKDFFVIYERWILEIMKLMCWN